MFRHELSNKKIKVNKIVSLTAYLLVLCAALVTPVLHITFWAKVLISFFPIAVLIFLFKYNFPLFVPTLFFALYSVLSPFIFLILEKLKINIPQIHFLPPIILYLIIIFLFRSIKKKVTWLKFGKLDKVTINLIIIMVLLSTVGLVSWSLLLAKDLTKFREFVPDLPLFVLVLYGLAFSITNSFFEEFFARAVLYDGFGKIFINKKPVIFSQALVFCAWHFEGFPGGLVGVVMVFIWSIFLGIIRCRSKGMFAPLLAHFFADFTIAIILYFIIVLPNH